MKMMLPDVIGHENQPQVHNTVRTIDETYV